MKKMKRLGMLVLIAVLSLSVLIGCSDGEDNGETSTQEDSNDNKGTVTIGYINWADSIAVSNLAKIVLEEKMGYDVELTMAEAGVIFTSIADNDYDLYLSMWLPRTHEDYYKTYKDDLVKVGVNYEGARIGLAVPEYVDIDSLDELNSVKDKLNGEIIGVDTGAGVMQASEIALEKYDLDYELQTGTGPVRTATLGEAIDNKEWIVVAAWEPHWKFAKWDLKFLEDPKNVYGESETSYIVSRKGFKEDMPEVNEFMENYHLDVGQVAEIMGRIDDEEDVEKAVRNWISENEEQVQSWIPETK